MTEETTAVEKTTAEPKAEETPKTYTQAEVDEMLKGKKYTDADMDEIVKKRVAREEKKAKAKVDEAKRLAEMDAQQKAEYERDQLQKEVESLRAEKTRNEMTKTARQMLTNDGVNVPDEIIASLVAEDAETTEGNVKAFSKAFLTAVNSAVKDTLKGTAPKTGGSPQITKKEIMEIKDRRERQKLIQDNMNLFRKGK